MATELDDKILPKVLDAIDRVGRNIEFKALGLDQYDPTTGAPLQAGETSYTVKATPPIGFDLKFIDNDIIRSGDVRVILAGSAGLVVTDITGATFVPDLNGQVIIDGTTFRILNIEKIYSGDEIAAWDLQLRK